MIRRIYRKLKKIVKTILRKCKKVVPVNIPVLYSELLTGRTALITGATSGIGFSISKSFLLSGSNVILTGRNFQKLEKTKDSLLEELGDVFNKKIETFLLDISNIETINKQFEIVLSETKFKSIDIFVNNAGINFGDGFGRTQKKDFESVFETNFEGTYFASQVFANYMKNFKIEGNILNITSSSCNRPAVSAYACSKWALRGLTQGMAKSLIPYGIVVNSLAPGPTATPMLIKDGYNGIELDKSPIGRYATAEEIANMAVILTSSLGRMIVGDIVMMTGGAGVITFDDVPYSF